MPSDDEKRNFAFRDENGEEDGVFTGRTPRQAAEKAARHRLEPASSEEVADREVIQLREHGTNRVHVYEAWSWLDDSPDNAPDWMGDTVTRANVSKQRIDHTD